MGGREKIAPQWPRFVSSGQEWINLLCTTRGFTSRFPAALRHIRVSPYRIEFAMGGSNTKEKPKEKEKRDQARIIKAISQAIESNAARLDLNNRHIRELPDNFEGQKTALKWLSLSHNELKALPDGVCLFVNLSALRLNGNQLSSLPQALSSLSSLQVLDLSKNKFTDWDPTITSIPNLTDLNLQCNQIGSVRPTLRAPLIHIDLRFPMENMLHYITSCSFSANNCRHLLFKPTKCIFSLCSNSSSSGPISHLAPPSYPSLTLFRIFLVI